jgi:hypothetical protein
MLAFAPATPAAFDDGNNIIHSTLLKLWNRNSIDQSYFNFHRSS